MGVAAAPASHADKCNAAHAGTRRYKKYYRRQ